MLKSIFIVVLGAVMALSVHAQNDTVDVPLNIDVRHIHSRVAVALGLDDQGAGELSADRCNRLDLSGLEVIPDVDSEALGLILDVQAHSGLEVLGRCTGPRPISSQVFLTLEPGLEDSGTAVRFRPGSAELRGPNGGGGLLAQSSRVLAENLILPRLQGVRVDIAEPLMAIDRLIEEFLPVGAEQPSPLAERGRLSHVAVLPDGLQAVLTFELRPVVGFEQAPEPVLDAGELAQWQRIEDELDGFLTVIIAHLALQVEDRELRLGLLSVLLDARHRIAEALASEEGESDPVRLLFTQTWEALRPVLMALDSINIADDVDLRLAGFLAAGDALEALDALGPEYGLQISRDGLRRLARMLLAEDAPASFTPLPLAPDPALRDLFGLGFDGAAPEALATVHSGRWWSRLVPMAHAAEALAPAEALRGLVPRLAIIDEYLDLVSRLLGKLLESHLADASRVPPEHMEIFDPLVRATAWKETCWRHYVGAVDEPQVIRSPVGAIGMMQIMGRVWRGVYDVERLEAEVEYNVAAGIEILEHYLVDYALRRGEHELSGGTDNLVRATYAAYNGGPSHLARYRREQTPASLRAIDNAFWRDYQQMKSQRWPDVGSCYSVGQ